MKRSSDSPAEARVTTAKSILITGASSGIGAALAESYAGSGVRLGLSGRDRARLDAVAEACRRRGAIVRAACIDVTDRAAMADWIAGADRDAPLDLVIANAGISAGRGGGHGVESAEQTEAILAVNLGWGLEHGVSGDPVDAGAPARANRDHGLAHRLPRLSRRPRLRAQQGRGPGLGRGAARRPLR